MTTQQPIDVRDMKIVHQGFRRAFVECASLVRAEASPSKDRVTFLANHVDFCVLLLHIHHEGEDLLMYPLLIERVPEKAASTEEIEHEHETIRQALDVVSANCQAWRTNPSAATNEALASSLDTLSKCADEHLTDEETKVLPIAAVTLSQAEWNALGKHAVSNIPPKMRPIGFGSMLEPLDKSDKDLMKQTLPAPVRVLYPVLIDRPWKKYAATLRGTSAN